MTNKWQGSGALVISLIVVFLWIPQDVDSGIIEKVRRNIQIGDSMAPTLAASLIGLGGLLLLVPGRTSASFLQTSAENKASPLRNATHALILLLIIAIALAMMRYAGPLALSLVSDVDSEYRLLRDTAPWKYIGFILGGTFLIAALIAWTEQRLKFSHVLMGLAATLVLIALYDLPFDNLLLPPNGDV